MSKVVVFGATGYVGGHVSAELLSRGHEAVGVSRGVREVEAPAGLRLIQGSIHDPEAVEAAIDGADAVVVAVRAAGGDRPLEESLGAMLPLLERSGARLAVVGGAASLQVVPGGPLVMDGAAFPEAAKPEAAAQKKVLEFLRSSETSVDWFYLSPARIFGAAKPGERTGGYRVGGDALVTDAEGVSHISGADYAIALVDELERPAHHSTRFTVGY